MVVVSGLRQAWQVLPWIQLVVSIIQAVIAAHAAGWAVGLPVPNPFDSPPPAQVFQAPPPPTTWVMTSSITNEHTNIYALHHSADGDRLYVRCRAELRVLSLLVRFNEPGYLFGNARNQVGMSLRLDDGPRVAQLWQGSISRTFAFAPRPVTLPLTRALVDANRLEVGAYSHMDGQWRYADFDLRTPDDTTHPVVRVLTICGYEA